MAKAQKNIRISKHTEAQLAEICDIWGETQTNVIAAAIGELYRKVKQKEQQERQAAMSTQEQDYITDHLDAESFDYVAKTYNGMTVDQIAASLDEMFHGEDNSELAERIHDAVRLF